jgi:hypothetical protein
MRPDEKRFVERKSKEAQVNNTGVGRVIAVTNDGRYTVRIDGRNIMVYSASGVTYNINDVVSIRYLSKDRRQAEIAERTTRRLATQTKQVWR